MARFNASEIENYGQQSGSGSYFSLKDDRDKATVRFMYESADDIEGYSVHKLKVGDKERYVNCNRHSYNSPIDDCPLCKAGVKVQAKLFVPLYDENSQSIKIWERGKQFYTKLCSLCDRYGNLISRTFEIERNGKKGDTKTTYEVYPLERDDSVREDFPEIPEIIGGIVLDKSADEMSYYIDYGEFPEANNSRRESRDYDRRREDDRYRDDMPVRRESSRRPSDSF